MNERKESDRLGKLARTYAAGVIEEADYRQQRAAVIRECEQQLYAEWSSEGEYHYEESAVEETVTKAHEKTTSVQALPESPSPFVDTSTPPPASQNVKLTIWDYLLLFLAAVAIAAGCYFVLP